MLDMMIGIDFPILGQILCRLLDFEFDFVLEVEGESFGFGRSEGGNSSLFSDFMLDMTFWINIR